MNENNKVPRKPLDSSTKIHQEYVKIEKENEFKEYLGNLRKPNGETYDSNYTKNCIGKLNFAASHLGIDISSINISEENLKIYKVKLKKVLHYRQNKILTNEQYYNSISALKKYIEFTKHNSLQFTSKDRLFDIRVIESSLLTSDERLFRINSSPKMPRTRTTTSETYIRNADVVAETLFKASGACQACLSPAPFNRKSDGTAYLEVHHKLPLAVGGEDALENTVAICPNCHRNEHYGNPKWPW